MNFKAYILVRLVSRKLKPKRGGIAVIFNVYADIKAIFHTNSNDKYCIAFLFYSENRHKVLLQHCFYVRFFRKTAKIAPCFINICRNIIAVLACKRKKIIVRKLYIFSFFSDMLFWKRYPLNIAVNADYRLVYICAVI